MLVWDVEYKVFNSILFHIILTVRASNADVAKNRADELLSSMNHNGFPEWVSTSDSTRKYYG